MSAIKQKAVTSSGHGKNLRNYINDKGTLLRDAQNLSIDQNWFREMRLTRETYGHDKPSRTGAKNTIMYHQIIAFLPDEADINGGVMTPEKCMAYAKEYAQTRYPHHEIAFALHKEHCEADGTYRYAVHMAINRTDLETGKRLAEGRGEAAKRDRAKAIRAMDEKWGLQQMERDKPNSKIHARQPRGAEKAIMDRGEKSYKNNLRGLAQYASEKAIDMDEFQSFLKEWGVATEIKNGKVYATDTDNAKYTFSVPRLDGALNISGLKDAFDQNNYNRRVDTFKKELDNNQRKAEEYAAAKADYKDVAEKRYKEYRQHAQKIKGTTFNDFPQLKLPRPTEELRKDPEIQAAVLSYLRKADNLRKKLASDTPLPKQSTNRAGLTGSRMNQSQNRTAQEQERQNNRKTER